MLRNTSLVFLSSRWYFLVFLSSPWYCLVFLCVPLYSFACLCMPLRALHACACAALHAVACSSTCHRMHVARPLPRMHLHAHDMPGMSGMRWHAHGMPGMSRLGLDKGRDASACAVPGLTWLQPTDLWEVNI